MPVTYVLGHAKTHEAAITGWGSAHKRQSPSRCRLAPPACCPGARAAKQAQQRASGRRYPPVMATGRRRRRRHARHHAEAAHDIMPKRCMTSCRSGACRTTACNSALCSVAEIGSAGADRVRIGSKSIEIIGGLRLSLVESFGRAIDRTLDRWVCLIDRQPAIDSDPHAARYIPPAWHPIQHVIPTRMVGGALSGTAPPSIMIVAPREKPSTALTAAAVRRCRYHMMRVRARGVWSECCPTCDSLGPATVGTNAAMWFVRTGASDQMRAAWSRASPQRRSLRGGPA